VNLWNLVEQVANQKLWLGLVLPAWLLVEDKISSNDFAMIASAAIISMGLVDAVRAWTGNEIDSWRASNGAVTLPAPPESSK
jgi:hypothetical protein